MSEIISAVIVTYNRLNFLQDVIEAVKNQTRKPDYIIVINNSSTDGTSEWLTGQNGLIVISQENVGSSGGQHTGFAKAFSLGSDWIWVMDDDVVPESKCLENLLKYSTTHKIIAPLRFTPKGKPYLNDTVYFNLSNPFKSFWGNIIKSSDIENDIIEAVGITFEGPLIHRLVVDTIGLPEFNFFIYGDDSEYFIRASKAGFKPILATSAKMQRKLNVEENTYDFGWKYFYIVRNQIAIDRLHGNFGVKTFRPFIYLFKWIIRSKNITDIKTTLRAFVSGYFYKSTMKEFP